MNTLSIEVKKRDKQSEKKEGEDKIDELTEG